MSSCKKYSSLFFSLSLAQWYQQKKKKKKNFSYFFSPLSLIDQKTKNKKKKKKGDKYIVHLFSFILERSRQYFYPLIH